MDISNIAEIYSNRDKARITVVMFHTKTCLKAKVVVVPSFGTKRKEGPFCGAGGMTTTNGGV